MNKRTKSREVSASSPASASPTQVPPVIAENLRRLRTQRQLTPAELAARSGLSPTELAAIEAGDREPSIKTVWSLANALGVPFRTLITKGADGEVPAQPRATTRRVLTSHEDGRDSEVFELKLPPSVEETVSARRAGAVENVLVTEGSAEIQAGALHYTLHTGESVSLRADHARHYRSLGEANATLYIIVSQPAE